MKRTTSEERVDCSTAGYKAQGVLSKERHQQALHQQIRVRNILDRADTRHNALDLKHMNSHGKKSIVAFPCLSSSSCKESKHHQFLGPANYVKLNISINFKKFKTVTVGSSTVILCKEWSAISEDKTSLSIPYCTSRYEQVQVLESKWRYNCTPTVMMFTRF